ncbi:type I restriction endonuclease subunit R [Phormidium sp. FACHB-1136]|nr:type I restriction endonuclease subunit R [Phormidium sp. FACHB-1136]
MVQTLAISEAISEGLTLKYLRESFNLSWVQEPDFFPEWQSEWPTLTAAQQQALDRIRDRYFHQLEEGSMLENGVKMMIVSPLLDLAGFYDPPFRCRFEPSVEVSLDTGETTLKGRIDTLVVNQQIWVWGLEAKRTTFSLSLGIPQALAYMLTNPQSQQPAYGLLCSGESFLFLKLSLQPSPQYGLSQHFNILNPGDLGQVLGILQHLGQLSLTTAEF